jgi:hypothetical protein
VLEDSIESYFYSIYWRNMECKSNQFGKWEFLVQDSFAKHETCRFVDRHRCCRDVVIAVKVFCPCQGFNPSYNARTHYVLFVCFFLDKTNTRTDLNFKYPWYKNDNPCPLSRTWPSIGCIIILFRLEMIYTLSESNHEMLERIRKIIFLMFKQMHNANNNTNDNNDMNNY